MTLVKYVDRKKLLSVRCRGFDTVSIPAEKLVQAGIDDNTVQDDGVTVWVSKGQYEHRIRPLLGR